MLVAHRVSLTVGSCVRMNRHLRLQRQMSGSIRQPRWKGYHLTATGSGCSSATLTDDGYEIASDTPIAAGGKATAPQPVQLLLAALVGCEQATANFVAAKMRLPAIRRIEFDIHAERDEWGSMAPPIRQSPQQVSRLQRIWGTATVFTDASESEVAEIAAAVKQRCPVANMVIASGCQLEVQWQKGEE
eukprot:TRINITY_DN83509_c0_g1_i1.p1 TRINITY_DN83509_c0_g1~~TRINITY_DN83509_c0_g1_i1.p1  ORF type:complete len:188 (-),score=27.61 TRINITY_DN83509_c0_g1_i1:182-745(-)